MLKAVVHAEKAGIQGLAYKDIQEREPEYGEVKVKLKVAGLNHRDLFVLHLGKLALLLNKMEEKQS